MKTKASERKAAPRPLKAKPGATASRYPSGAASRFPRASALAERSSGGAGRTIMRQALPGAPDLRLRPGPSFARMMGYLRLDAFGFDKSDLTELHRKRLADQAKTLRALLEDYPGGSVRVIGYTDSVGDEGYNLALGQRRADAVRDMLVAEGVPDEAIWTDSAGEAGLRVNTQRAHPQNRRVIVAFQPEPMARLDATLELTPPTLPKETSPLRLDLPPLPPETLEEQVERSLQWDIPKLPRESMTGWFWRQVDDGLDSVMDRLHVPDWARGIVRDGVHAAMEKGAGEALQRAMDQANLGSEEQEAIRAAIRALLESKAVPL